MKLKPDQVELIRVALREKEQRDSAEALRLYNPAQESSKLHKSAAQANLLRLLLEDNIAIRVDEVES